MELQINPNVTYAIALEGGGARGAWQVGAWRALEEAGIKYNAVSGTSVGALNGAFFAMRALDEAERLWKEVNYSKVMRVNDSDMKKIMKGHVLDVEFDRLIRSAESIVKGKGFDVTPLRDLLHSVVDEERVRSSDVRFFMTTYCVTDKEELELEASRLPEGMIPEMMLASAYFPAFKHEPINGKLYTDGGVKDVLPLHVLIDNGYKDILALRIHGFGIERKVRIPEDVNVTTIEPNSNLGSVLEFDGEHAHFLLQLGYYDTKRALYGLEGKQYYLERTMSEVDAYVYLARLVETLCRIEGKDYTLRSIHETYLPKLAQQSAPFGDYYEVYIAFLEKCAEQMQMNAFQIRTDREFADEVKAQAALRKRKGLLKYFSEE